MGAGSRVAASPKPTVMSLDEVLVTRGLDRGLAVADTEFAVDRAAMRLHGIERDKEVGCDVALRPVRGQVPQDGHLPLGELLAENGESAAAHLGEAMARFDTSQVSTRDARIGTPGEDDPGFGEEQFPCGVTQADERVAADRQDVTQREIGGHPSGQIQGV
jgi:hypothetical protein